MSPLIPDRCFAINRFLWKCTLLCIAVDALGMWHYRIRIDMAQAQYLPLLLAACLLVSFFYRYIRKDMAIFLFCQMASQLILLTAALAIFSYWTAEFNLPLLDAWFIRTDHFFRLDWRSWLYWVQARPALAQALTFAYTSGEPQMLVLMILLFLYKQLPHIQRFLIAFLYAGLLVIFFAALLPAMGGFVYYNIDPGQLPHLPAAARAHEATLLALRGHRLPVMLFPLLGIVTFPSFHSAMAVILIYAARPVRWVYCISLPLNLLMLMSTPGDGGHYFVDVVAGVLIALHAIYMAKRMLPPQEDRLPEIIVAGN